MPKIPTETVTHDNVTAKGTIRSFYELQVHPVTSESKVLAMVSITINKEFVLTGFRLVNGKNGPFLSSPSYLNKDGNYKDYSYPLTAELRAYLTDTAVKLYESQ